jgi:hypothetical protein
MNPELYVWLAGGIAVGAAVAGLPATAPGAPPRLWPSVVGLTGLIVALLLVGIVSGTFVRHVIQLMPAFAALALVATGAPLSRSATLPILTFWLTLMVVIWLFLLGVRQVIGGRFTVAEIALTIGIAAACLAGLVGGATPTAQISRPRRAAIAGAFGLLQIAALWASLQGFAR